MAITRPARLISALAGTVAVALFATSANAEWCLGDHNTPLIDGLKGNQGIRTDPATVSGVSFVHTAQVNIDVAGTFVAIGTYKGAGTAGGQPNCPAHYDPGSHWSGFYDGEINGVYFCTSFGTNQWLAGANPSFKIEWAYCPTIGNRWVLTFAGTTRTCIFGPSSAVAVTGGLETVQASTVDRNIDVKWTNMMWSVGGNTFVNVGNTQPGYCDDFYTYQYVSDSSWNTYLAPLN
jgi:hypothetical protein